MAEMTNEQMVRRAGYASVEEYNNAVRYERSPAGQAELAKSKAVFDQQRAEQEAIEKTANTSSPKYQKQLQLDEYVRKYALDLGWAIPYTYDYLLSHDPVAKQMYRESVEPGIPAIPPSELPRRVTDRGAGAGEPRGSVLPNVAVGKSGPVAPIIAESFAQAQALAKSYAGLHGRAGEEILAVLKRLAGGGDKLAVELQELLRTSEKNLADARLLDAKRPL